MSIVLIAEDDEAVRVLTQSIIEEMGHIGLTAAKTEEALAFYCRLGNAPGVAISFLQPIKLNVGRKRAVQI